MSNKNYRLVFDMSDGSTKNVDFSVPIGMSVQEYTTNVPASNWTAYGNAYKQEVTVTGILETDRPIIDVQLSGASADDVASDITLDEEWLKVFRIITGADNISIYAKQMPNVDLPIAIKVVR